VTVYDHATVGAYSGVHQFCRVGAYAFVGGYTVVTKDALPYSKTVGNRACLYGANSLGLERRGFSRERIDRIRSAFRILQRNGLNVSQAIEKLDEAGDDEDVRRLVDFIRSSERGVVIRRGRDDAE
jgi:UDP-N-acetylglucosamine acyltransferase